MTSSNREKLLQKMVYVLLLNQFGYVVAENFKKDFDAGVFPDAGGMS